MNNFCKIYRSTLAHFPAWGTVSSMCDVVLTWHDALINELLPGTSLLQPQLKDCMKQQQGHYGHGTTQHYTHTHSLDRICTNRHAHKRMNTQTNSEEYKTNPTYFPPFYKHCITAPFKKPCILPVAIPPLPPPPTTLASKYKLRKSWKYKV